MTGGCRSSRVSEMCGNTEFGISTGVLLLFGLLALLLRDLALVGDLEGDDDVTSTSTSPLSFFGCHSKRGDADLRLVLVQVACGDAGSGSPLGSGSSRGTGGGTTFNGDGPCGSGGTPKPLPLLLASSFCGVAAHFNTVSAVCATNHACFLSATSS